MKLEGLGRYTPKVKMRPYTPMPSNGVMMEGSSTAPGVNMAFGRGISQNDFNNLMAGKVLYFMGAAGHSSIGAWPAEPVRSPFNDYFAQAGGRTSGNSLFKTNTLASMTTQSFNQQQNKQGNIDALIAVAAFATAGAAGYAAGAAGAAGTGTTLATGATVDASLPGLTSAELATETANATAALSASDAAAAATLPGLTSTELATETANATAALATPSVTTSTSLLTQAGNWASSQIPTTDSLITSGESYAGTQATKLITSILSPPAASNPLTPAAPSLSTIPANVPVATKSLTSTIMPLILGGISLLAFLK